MSRSCEHQPDRTRSRAPERTAHLCVRRMWDIVYLSNCGQLWQRGSTSWVQCATPRRYKGTRMAVGDLRDQIADIEADIDELAKTLDGCRKAMLFSKVAMAAGAIWILAYLLGAIRFGP